MSESVDDDCLDMKQLGQGDHDAYARLYRRHSPVVLALCRRGLVDRFEAEDACQEAFIRAFRKLDSLQDCRGFRPWIYAIAKFVCSEMRRARGRRHQHEIASVSAATQMAAAAPTDPSARHDSLRALGLALDSLPETERLAIHIYYMERDPITAAQSALGLGRSAFYKTLARARESLGAAMKETCNV